MLGDTYQIICTDETIDDIVAALVKNGVFRKLEENPTAVSATKTISTFVYPSAQEVNKEAPTEEALTTEGVDRFLNNHLPLESTIEDISSENIGYAEDRKMWAKELKLAVKQYGHDEVISAFYEWTSSQSNFVGKKPVSMFLKNVGSFIGMTGKKPVVSNPLLDRTEKEISYNTDGRVFFAGDYRIRLAVLLKTHGRELVVEAFNTFYQDVDDRGINFAAKNFLERAEVLISTIKRQKSEAAYQQQLVIEQIKHAQEQVIPEEEEENDL